MLKKRQVAFLDRRGDSRSELTTLSYEYPANYIVPLHFHKEDQLVFACNGVMTIHTEQGVWVVPPLRAVWIPNKVVHSINMSGAVSMRTLYFAPRLVKTAPKNCSVINASPLLRELILHACGFPRLRRSVAKERKVLELVIDQLLKHPRRFRCNFRIHPICGRNA